MRNTAQSLLFRSCRCLPFAVVALGLSLAGCGSDVGTVGPVLADTGADGQDVQGGEVTDPDGTGTDVVWVDQWVDSACVVDADCDDGNLCTQEACVAGQCASATPFACPAAPCFVASCNPQTGKCEQSPISCDDGDPCTADQCTNGQCQHLAVPGCGMSCAGDEYCDDGNPCTKDVCAWGSGQCVHQLLEGCAEPCQGDASCDDGDPCTQDVCTDAGMCEHLQMDGCYPKCFNDYDCNDGNPCTQDMCIGGQCQFAQLPGCGDQCKDSAQCEDGNACTADQCIQGTCVYSVAKCNDGDPCTNDMCDPTIGCLFSPSPNCCTNDKDCDDGNLCTKEACMGGKCVTAGGLACPAKPCYTASCNPMTGQCEEQPQNCDDGDACTSDACAAGTGQCVHKLLPGCAGCQSDLQCDDKLPCTLDKCVISADGFGKCQHSPSSAKGCCNPMIDMMQCVDGNICTQDVCDYNTFQCSNPLIPGCNAGCKSEFDCNDGIACTVDKCLVSSSGVGKCVYTQANLKSCCTPSMSAPQCDDGNKCTKDWCENWTCQHAKDPACTPGCTSDAQCNDNNPCSKDYCDPMSGQCMHASSSNCQPCKMDMECNDGIACSIDICKGATPDGQLGMCVWVQQVCNDSNNCTMDSCDPKSGKCVYLPIPGCGTLCKPGQCDDGNPCTKDLCDATNGKCSYVQDPNCAIPCKDASMCDDKNACTSELCISGKCQYKTLTCNDGNPCTTDACQQPYGFCTNTPIEGCYAKKCQSSLECADKNQCTADACKYGFCYNDPIPGCLGPPTP